VLGGSHWDDVEFAKLQKELTGMNSEEFLIGATPERWDVIWDWSAPVTLQISPEGVNFRYRFQSITVNGRRFDTAFDVQSRFAVVPTNLGLEFHRNSAVAATSLSEQVPLDPELEAIIERKFAGLFEDVFYLDGIQFPTGGDFNKLSQFELSTVKLEPSWIHIFASQKADVVPDVILK